MTEFNNVDNYLSKKWEVFKNQQISRTIASMKPAIHNKCPSSFSDITKKKITHGLPLSKNRFYEYMRNQDNLNFKNRLKQISTSHSFTYKRFLKPKNKNLNKKIICNTFKPSIFTHERLNQLYIKEENNLLSKRLVQSKSFFYGNEKIFRKINILPQSTRMNTIKQNGSMPVIGKVEESDIKELINENKSYNKKRFINGIGLAFVSIYIDNANTMIIRIKPFVNRQHMYYIIFEDESSLKKIDRYFSCFDNLIRLIVFDGIRLLIKTKRKLDYIVKVEEQQSRN